MPQEGQILDYGESIYTSPQIAEISGIPQHPFQMILDHTIARRVEQEQLHRIWEEGRNTSRMLALMHGRCDICTLKPPCRHRNVSSGQSFSHGARPRAPSKVEHLASVLQHNPEIPGESLRGLTKSAAHDDLNDKIANESIMKFSSSHKSRHSVNALDF